MAQGERTKRLREEKCPTKHPRDLSRNVRHLYKNDDEQRGTGMNGRTHERMNCCMKAYAHQREEKT